ncbi:MAG: hypothetical protein QW456_05165 [Ignisphaera sp.]
MLRSVKSKNLRQLMYSVCGALFYAFWFLVLYDCILKDFSVLNECFIYFNTLCIVHFARVAALVILPLISSILLILVLLSR